MLIFKTLRHIHLHERHAMAITDLPTVDRAILPQGVCPVLHTRLRGLYVLVRPHEGEPMPSPDDRASWLNDGATWRGGLEQTAHPKTYEIDFDVSLEERSFAKAYAQAKGVIEAMPFYMQQLSVFHKWTEYGMLNGRGKKMLALVARLEASATEPLRDALHEKKVARKEEGIARAQSYNEAQRAEAQARRAEREAEKLAQKEEKQQWALAEAQLKAVLAASRAEWKPGTIPVMAWLPAEDELVLRAAAREAKVSVYALTAGVITTLCTQLEGK